jgi:hypothetical protein
MQVTGVTLVLGLGLEVGDTPPVVVSVELELEADGVLDAANEAHAGVGLLVHAVVSSTA